MCKRSSKIHWKHILWKTTWISKNVYQHKHHLVLPLKRILLFFLKSNSYEGNTSHAFYIYNFNNSTKILSLLLLTHANEFLKVPSLTDNKWNIPGPPRFSKIETLRRINVTKQIQLSDAQTERAMETSAIVIWTRPSHQ